MLAVQGPGAIDRLAAVFPEAAAVGRFRVAHVEWAGAPCTVAGTGYTGERGVEIAVPAEAPPTSGTPWSAPVSCRPGSAPVTRCASRPGCPLHGHELGPGITPLQAGLAWVVAWSKPSFRGRAALEAERERGVARHLVGIATEGRRPPRAGCPVVVDGETVGEVTSGNFSPVLGHGIALAFVRPDVGEGATVTVDVRGTACPARSCRRRSSAAEPVLVRILAARVARIRTRTSSGASASLRRRGLLRAASAGRFLAGGAASSPEPRGRRSLLAAAGGRGVAVAGVVAGVARASGSTTR